MRRTKIAAHFWECWAENGERPFEGTGNIGTSSLSFAKRFECRVLKPLCFWSRFWLCASLLHLAQISSPGAAICSAAEGKKIFLVSFRNRYVCPGAWTSLLFLRNSLCACFRITISFWKYGSVAAGISFEFSVLLVLWSLRAEPGKSFLYSRWWRRWWRGRRRNRDN